jgi:hypothetical protein
MWGLWRFTTKLSRYLVEPQNQDRRLSERRWDPGPPRSFDVGEHVAGSEGLRWVDADIYAPEGFVSQIKC